MAEPTVRPHKNARNDLTADYVRKLLAYDTETGAITWRRRDSREFNTRWSGKPAGCVTPDGAILIRLNGVLYLAHRIAWLIVTGNWPPYEIDHINGNRSDNKWQNLRAASSSENLRNRGAARNNASGFKGVCYALTTAAGISRWQAKIMLHRKSYYLGCFDTPEEAHAAYKAAAEKLHGEFAKTE